MHKHSRAACSHVSSDFKLQRCPVERCLFVFTFFVVSPRYVLSVICFDDPVTNSVFWLSHWLQLSCMIRETLVIQFWLPHFELFSVLLWQPKACKIWLDLVINFQLCYTSAVNTMEAVNNTAAAVFHIQWSGVFLDDCYCPSTPDFVDKINANESANKKTKKKTTEVDGLASKCLFVICQFSQS